MLKGHVFSKQIFGNPIFALFINTFLNGRDGVSNNYKNGMQVTYGGSNVTVASGAVCIQGRFLEEDTGSTISAGTDTAYCKLVIEVNLDLQNTESQFNQASYKIIKSASSYPNLTQTNIVKNNAGIYQYELARFRTNASGITDFQDKRTFLDFDSIYDMIETECNALLVQIQQELLSVKDGSAYFLKSSILTNQDLNDYKTEGFYYATGGNTCSNKPNGVNNFGLIIKRTAAGNHEQIMDVNDTRYTRFWNGSTWSSWIKTITNGDFAVIMGNFSLSASTNYSADINYPNGFNKNNCVVISFGLVIQGDTNAKGYNFVGNYNDSSDLLNNALNRSVNLRDGQIHIVVKSPGNTGNYNFKIVLMKITNPEVTLLGDANCDGVVNSADATLIQNYIQGNSALSLQGFVNADVTKDGDVKASDYTKLQDYLDGDISSLE